jgi:hypothetical protein
LQKDLADRHGLPSAAAIADVRRRPFAIVQTPGPATV